MNFCEHDEKLWEIARTEYALLKQDEREYLKLHFGYSHHHFGFGLYLRNKYFMDFPLEGDNDRDELGAEIFKRIIAIMFTAFENNLDIIESVTRRFETLNIQYSLKYGKFFIDEISWKDYLKCGNFPRDDPAIAALSEEEIDAKRDEWYNTFISEHKAYGKAVFEKLLNRDNFIKKASGYGYSAEEINDTLSLSEKIFDDQFQFAYLPPEILFFKSADSLNEAMSCKNIYEWIAKNKSEFFEKFPAYLTENREFAMTAVSACGYTIQYFPKFKDDTDLIKAAVTSNTSALKYIDSKYITREIAELAARNSKNALIFSYNSMDAYRDDDVTVKLAIEANGANIAYTSERIRDTYEFAEAALKNQKRIYAHTAYEALSDRLKRDRSLALIEAASYYPALDIFIDEFLDDDDIAEIIYNSGSQHMMHYMSKRIREKYNV